MPALTFHPQSAATDADSHQEEEAMTREDKADALARRVREIAADERRLALQATTYSITLARISTGAQALSMVTRQPDEQAAYAYAQAAIAQDEDLRVVEVRAR